MTQDPRTSRDLEGSRPEADAAEDRRRQQEALRERQAREGGTGAAEQPRDNSIEDIAKDIGEAPRSGAFPFEKSQ